MTNTTTTQSQFFMSDDEVNARNPRQAAILIQVPANDRRAVLSHAFFRQNVSGGNLSSNLQMALEAFRQAGSAQALRDEDVAASTRLSSLGF